MHLFEWENNKLDIYDNTDSYQQALNIIVHAYNNFTVDREFICIWANENILEWTRILFDYYRKPNQTIISNHSLINHRLENKELNMDMESWKSPQIKTAFLNLFLLLDNNILKKSENISKVLSPIVIMAEDHETANRLIGMKCIYHFLLFGDRKMMEKMGLCDLFWKISNCSITFEDEKLFIETWNVLHLLYDSGNNDLLREGLKSYQNRYDELLEFAINESRIARYNWSRSQYLENIILMLRKGGLYAVTHLPEILQMTEECIHTNSVLIDEILNLLLDTCKPRIDIALHHQNRIKGIFRQIRKELCKENQSLKI